MTSNRVNNDASERDQNSIVNSVSDYCFISDLPDSILNGIFYRLPIQSVSSCKCVCSSWNNLISQPSFSVNYARNSPFTALLNRLYEHPGSVAPGKLLVLEITENGDYIRSRIKQKIPPWSRYSSFTCIGSSNGFICMREHVVGRFDAIYVNNPILGDTIQLPRCFEIPDRFVDYKFGFCLATNRFKVLRTVCRRYITDCFIDECEIFTVGVDNVWRRLPNSFTILPFDVSFVSLDGFFHWFCKGSGLISIFNLAEEQFGQISVPPSLSLVSKAVKMVGIGNQLTLVDCSATQISIWKMKKHLDVESWAEVVIPASWFPSELQTGTRFPFAVAELQNGDMCWVFYNILCRSFLSKYLPSRVPCGSFMCFLENCGSCLIVYCKLSFNNMLFRCFINSLIYCNIEQKRCSEIKRIGVYLCMTDFIPGYTPNFWLHARILLRADVRPRNSENVQQE